MPEPQGTPTLWEEWVNAFLAEQRDAKGHRERTLELHMQSLSLMRRALDRVGAPADPRDLTRAHIVAAIVHLRNSGRQPRTINLQLQSLSQLFAFAVAEGRCPGNPVASVPRQRVPDKPPRALHDDELVRVLQAPKAETFAGMRDRVMMRLMLDTGLRLGEVLRLRLDDLDLPHRAVHVSEESKTHAVRFVYLSAGTAAALDGYIERRGALRHDFVFVSRQGRPINRYTVEENFERYGAAAGVRLTPHRLRHSFARMYLANGGDPLSLQQILGHSDLEMVKRYARLWGSDLQALHDRYSPLRRLDLH